MMLVTALVYTTLFALGLAFVVTEARKTFIRAAFWLIRRV